MDVRYAVYAMAKPLQTFGFEDWVLETKQLCDSIDTLKYMRFYDLNCGV